MGSYHHPQPLHAFTPARRVIFCDHLSSSGNVRAACARAGVSPNGAYRARRRDAEFAAAWDAALVLAREHAEAVLAERALNGIEEAVFYHGEEVARRRRFDGRLLLAHLARLDARCADPAAVAAAGRFDELLALVGGEEAGFAPAPGADRDAFVEACRREATEPFLEAEEQDDGEEGWDEADEPDPEFEAERAAIAEAEDEWDDWRDGAEARIDALCAGADAGGEGGGKGLADFSQDPVTCVNQPAEGRAADGSDGGRNGGNHAPAQDFALVSKQLTQDDTNGHPPALAGRATIAVSERQLPAAAGPLEPPAAGAVVSG